MQTSPDPWCRWMLVAMLVLVGGVGVGLAQEGAALPPGLAPPLVADARGDLILVLGAPGTPEFEEQFRKAMDCWEQGAVQGGLRRILIGASEASESPADRQQLLDALDRASDSSLPLWIVLIGHGTFDGRAAKFNLRGDDVSAEDLRRHLAPLQRPVAIVASFSASAPFLEALSGPGRIVISATKSGTEANLSRFGGYFATAIIDQANDLDKDGQVSLLEAFLTAARQTLAFYEGEGRLASEHPLLDDNGDARGTRAESYQGIRLVEKDKSVAWDGLRAHQWHLIPSSDERRLPSELAARRDALELAIARLRDLKSTLPEDIYYRELEVLLLDMARIYATIDKPRVESK